MSEPDSSDGTSQTEAALELIRMRIIDLTIGPGSRIDERLLLRQFGLGRTPAREAISRLAAEGFVHIRPNRGGVFVRSLDLDTIKQVIVAHQLVESVVGQLCTLDDDQLGDDLAAIQKQYRTVVSAGSFLEITALNERFHLRIIDTLHNEFFAAFAVSTHRHVRRLLMYLYRLEQATPVEQKRQFALNLVEHHAIIEAARTRDHAAFAKLLPEHARATQDRLKRIVSSGTVPNLVIDLDSGALQTGPPAGRRSDENAGKGTRPGTSPEEPNRPRTRRPTTK
ncbi:GntR family transcriptional regulator [Nakamurella sp. PAMC28650]|uniref:GntR family transcriptional regulator n=1 Tax=Nakamurella sp. PAMC28650 TaxID=2762325 RepID=UPI00164E8109|nr:GntR family transcriptional regulator [Nakamurella sp. PAMC28650]QNK82715.1 GntR family transcriptional regulator [Nakamurella sp. PAMC28650]